MITEQQLTSQLTSPSPEDIDLVERAYKAAEKAHAGQTRYSGEPYFSHVVAVAYKLAEMGLGPRTVAAALLHDTLEDTELTAEKIKKEFGEEVLFLVDGVTKLGSVRYYGSDRHNESLRKLFVAVSQDIRVLIIKLADRLHNMQTLEHVPQEKQKRIARETLEIYVPVAHRIGMNRIRKEIEDLAFPYVYPEDYARVTELIESRVARLEETLERERKNLQKRLVESGLKDFSTSCRVKGMYSLYHKLKRREWNIDRIYDLLAIRVVVPDVEQCYQVLGTIHKIWRPLPSRIKDYISFPKPNGYRSIHTTVTTPNGNILEVQIRTKEMHHEAEFGIAAHIIYKQQRLEHGTATKASSSWFGNLVPSIFRPFSRQHKQVVKTDQTEHTEALSDKEKIPKWISEIGEMYTDTSDGNAFMDDMRRDFFMNRIFVFTPNGDVVDLPLGATPIDFAYAIHSEIGNHTTRAKVNNKLVSLDSGLRNGDIVTIETSKNAKPTKKWLDIATTSLARRRIRSRLTEENQG